MAILTLSRGIHLAAENVGQGLHSITDAKDGQARLDDKFLYIWRARLVDRGRTPRKNEALWVDRHDLVLRRVPREQLRVDVCFAHASGDQLGVLGTVI